VRTAGTQRTAILVCRRLINYFEIILIRGVNVSA
jgi:hypothetical protein